MDTDALDLDGVGCLIIRKPGNYFTERSRSTSVPQTSMTLTLSYEAINPCFILLDAVSGLDIDDDAVNHPYSEII